MESCSEALALCKDQDAELTPPLLELQGLRNIKEAADIVAKATSASSTAPLETEDPALMQFADMLVWETPQCDPDPGQIVTLRKYIPVDLMQVYTAFLLFLLLLTIFIYRLQIPEKVSTLSDAIKAIRMCNRLCTLIENQNHCIKNDKFIIAAMIEHVFIQVGLTNNNHVRIWFDMSEFVVVQNFGFIDCTSA